MDPKGFGAVLNNHGAIMSASPALAGCCWLCRLLPAAAVAVGEARGVLPVTSAIRAKRATWRREAKPSACVPRARTQAADVERARAANPGRDGEHVRIWERDRRWCRRLAAHRRVEIGRAHV